MTQQLDTIHIHNLKAHTSIGCGQNERAYPQRLLFDLDISVFLQDKSWEKKGLDGTVCYAKASELVKEIATEKSWVYLEDLAEEISQRIFQQFGRAEQLSLRIHKFAVADTDSVGLSITRTRNT